MSFLATIPFYPFLLIPAYFTLNNLFISVSLSRSFSLPSPLNHAHFETGPTFEGSGELRDLICLPVSPYPAISPDVKQLMSLLSEFGKVVYLLSLWRGRKEHFLPEQVWSLLSGVLSGVKKSVNTKTFELSKITDAAYIVLTCLRGFSAHTHIWQL